MAIFPVEEMNGVAGACEQALAATDETIEALTTWDRDRHASGDDPVEYGIVLHIGEVSFGNVGTANRLDFTVIGPAVNLTSRLERLCSELGETVLLSDQLARHVQARAAPVGVHRLRGLAEPQMVHRLI